MTVLPPITKEEALKYDPEAIEIDIARRKKNMQIFRDQVIAEEQEIQRLEQILAIINVYK